MAVHYMSTGIDFQDFAHGAGADNELLDDYEEGDWTGTWIGGTTAGNSPTATMKYQKLGYGVWAWFEFANASTASAVGQMIVTGLPFANNGNIVSVSKEPSTHQMSFHTSHRFALFLEANVTQMTGLAFQDGGSWTGWDITAGTGKYLRCSIDYYI